MPLTFPVYFDILGLRLHSHTVLECVAYFVGFQTYLLLRKRKNDLPVEASLWIIVGAVFGALLGSKLLAWMESPHEFWAARADLRVMLGGKTIVGGLLGGWFGVEIAKKIIGVSIRTGDACVWPLALGTAIGRIGCFLAGLEDRTYGIATSVPWGVDFGDGIQRHPTQLYESIFVLALAGIIHVTGNGRPEGARFRLYMLGYLLFRIVVEFIKPTYRPYAGLSAIQLAAIAGAFACIMQLIERQRLAHPTTALEAK